MITPLARTGAVFYLLWGLLHIWASYQTYRLGAGMEPGPAQARVFQDAGFMLALSIAVVVIAVRMNWRNSAVGYWVNLALVTLADVLFIGLILLPGYIPLGMGLLGPVLWILAVIFASLGYLREPRDDLATQAA